MTFRTIIITQKSKLSYKNNYLVIRNDDLIKIHLSELDTVIVDSLQVTITTYLLAEMANRNIKVLICDNEHNPVGEMFPLYGSHNTSKKIRLQSHWTDKQKQKVWQEIIKTKILNQSHILQIEGLTEALMLKEYANEVELGDRTNREGHAAKVYFNALFGNDFNRNFKNDINAALNYGYSLLLSSFNKEIVRLGHVTQLGINHKNEFNPFNLSSDLMESFRPIIDKHVIQHPGSFNNQYKYNLVSLLNDQYKYKGKEYRLKDIIRMYTKAILDNLNDPKIDKKTVFLL